MAYFDYTAALGGSCAALSHAELPSFSLPASLVRPRLHLVMAGVAGWRRSFVNSSPKRNVNPQSRCRSDVVEDHRSCVDLILESAWEKPVLPMELTVLLLKVPRGARHWRRFTTARHAEHLSTLDEVIYRTVDLCTYRSAS